MGHLEQFCLYYTGFTSSVLFIPAFFSYLTSHVEVDASWESIDYALMSLSFLFMSCNLYSDLWLGLSLSARAYAVFDHTKYLGASVSRKAVCLTKKERGSIKNFIVFLFEAFRFHITLVSEVLILLETVY
uniref:Pecanex-like protein n=1 Tax=Angiostrongylus cantonensis TaxID=6313 RepID=A0A0K0DLT1_ANGCA